jgi:membrane-associated phospholipid phosphatase
MAAGGHFLSDVLFCGLVMAALMRLLYLLLLEPDGIARLRAWWQWASSRTAGRLMLALILLAIATMLFAEHLDRAIATEARALPASLRAVMSEITRLGVSTGWLILTGLPVILFWLLRGWLPEARRRVWQSRAYLPLFIFVAVGGAGLVNSLVKAAAGRLRPKLYFLDQSYGFDLWHRAADYTSFPSGHTVVIFALATSVTLIWRPLALPAFTLAVLVGLSRILIGAHWPSDVLAGAWVGIAWTLWMRHVFASHGVTFPEAKAGTARWQGPLWRLPAAWRRA